MIAQPQDPQADLKVTDVAALLRVNMGKVLSWIATGELGAVDISLTHGVGRPRWRITREDLTAFRAGRRTSRQSTPPKRRRQQRPAVAGIEYF